MKNLLIKIICLLFLTSCCCQEKTKFYSKKCLPNNLQNDNKNNNCLLFYKNYELPQYQVQKTIDETIEMRHYQARIVAEVVVAGTQKQAVKKGFRALASYIFGNNIAMTSPVNQTLQQENQWLIQFGMPHYFTLDTLPKPKNPNINLHIISQQKAVAIIFSGVWSDEKFAFHLQKLKKYLTENNLQTIAEPSFAYYDDPFTFPWNRKNEIIWQIQEK